MAVELPRHKFTADEYQQLGRSGIFTEDDHVELLDGDIDQAKLPAYARSGTPEVWLVDLQDQVLLSHRQPVAAEYRLRILG